MTAIVFDCPTVAVVVGVGVADVVVVVVGVDVFFVVTFAVSGNTNAIANDDGVGFTSLLRS